MLMQILHQHLDVIHGGLRHDASLGVPCAHGDLDEAQVLDIQHLAYDVDGLVVACRALGQGDQFGGGAAVRAPVEGAGPDAAAEAVRA